jgi:flagellar biosynthesis component FlhA
MNMRPVAFFAAVVLAFVVGGALGGLMGYSSAREAISVATTSAKATETPAKQEEPKPRERSAEEQTAALEEAIEHARVVLETVELRKVIRSQQAEIEAQQRLINEFKTMLQDLGVLPPPKV